MRRTIGLVVLLLAYVLLLPGLSKPILSITATAEKSELVALGKRLIEENSETSVLMGSVASMLLNQMDTNGSVEAYHKTRSILGTVRDLFQNKHFVVGFLIMLFSVVVPVIKGFMLLLAHMKISPSMSVKMKNYSGLISKWSMADVFVIGIFVAYLAANAIEKEAGLLSFDATLGAGFYFFLGYCLLSILSAQLLADENNNGGSAK